VTIPAELGCLDAPYGWDVFTHTEVIPKPGPTGWLHWTVGPVDHKPAGWGPQPAGPPSLPTTESEIIVQLTADQQVRLTVSGTDRYGNPVAITGDSVWLSSDETIIQVQPDADGASAVAVAVGPIGTASVTFTNDVNSDGTGDFIGSLAIDVVGGDMTEIVFDAGEPEDKPVAAQLPS